MRVLSMLAAAAALALSSVALAQTGAGGTKPAGPDIAPRDASGAASTSNTIDSPTDDRNEAMGMRRDVSTGRNDDPRAVAITDEYGNRYNSRGERIGHGAPIR